MEPGSGAPCFSSEAGAVRAAPHGRGRGCGSGTKPRSSTSARGSSSTGVGAGALLPRHVRTGVPSLGFPAYTAAGSGGPSAPGDATSTAALGEGSERDRQHGCVRGWWERDCRCGSGQALR